MPMLSTFGGGSARGFGLQVKSNIVLADSTTMDLKVAHDGENSSGTISLVSGYSATINVILVGDATEAGYPFPYNCGEGASGEYAKFSIVLGGDETNFSYNFSNGGSQGSSGGNTLSFTVNGGTRNGTIIRAGSGGPHSSYGNGCPATSKSGTITGTATRIEYGAYANSAGSSYSDGYFYSACGSSYGNGSNGYSGYGQAAGCSTGARGAVFIQYLNDY